MLSKLSKQTGIGHQDTSNYRPKDLTHQPSEAVVKETKKPLPEIENNKGFIAYHNFNALSNFPAPTLPIQPKLKMNTPGDQYEQQADRVARQVVTSSLPTESIQKGLSIPKTITPSTRISSAVTEQLQQNRHGGRLLKRDIQHDMESRFRTNFQGVRIHTDHKAMELNEQLQARAFTIGNHIYFNDKAYQPNTPSGQQLLAHELTHVVQQNGTEKLLMRTPKSLSSSIDPSKLPHQVLEDEIIEIQKWLALPGATTAEKQQLRPILETMMMEKHRRSLYNERIDPGGRKTPAGKLPIVLIPSSQATTPQIKSPRAPSRTTYWRQAHSRPPALSIEEQFNFLFNTMGFASSKPGTPVRDPKEVGANVGPTRAPGYQVYAAMQVIDKEGRQVMISVEAYLGGKGKPHGEEQTIRNLRNNLPKEGSLRGGKLITTVTQNPCGANRHNCTRQIDKFAQEYGLSAKTYVPIRDAVRRNAPPVKPPTAARGAQRTDRPPVRYRLLHQLALPSLSATPMQTVSQPASATSPTQQKGIRKEIGTPDMRPSFVGGPSAKGSGITAAGSLAFMGINFTTNLINDYIQGKRMQEELQKKEPRLRKLRQKRPELGILLLFHFEQNMGSPESLLQPGAEFKFIDTFTGRTIDEARDRYRKSAKIGSNRPNTRKFKEEVWIPPVIAPTARVIRKPFPSYALATFVPGNAMLQQVEWNGILGFDDEGSSSLKIGKNTEAKFLVLHVPEQINFLHAGSWYDVNIPNKMGSAQQGGSIPVVNLDPVLPGFNVSAACVFPADEFTAALFNRTRATKDNLGQLRNFVNFGKVRWVRPENIKVLQVL